MYAFGIVVPLQQKLYTLTQCTINVIPLSDILNRFPESSLSQFVNIEIERYSKPPSPVFTLYDNCYDNYEDAVDYNFDFSKLEQ